MTRRPDYIFITVIAILLVGGLVMLASASVDVSYRRFGSTSAYIVNQLLSGVLVGGIAFLIVQRIPYVFWRKIAVPLLLGTIVLLAAVFSDAVGFEAFGARRWIYYGALFFQPSELAKLAIIIYLAAFFAKQKSFGPGFLHGILPFLIVSGIIIGLIVMEPDVGTLGVIVLTVGAIFIAAGGGWKYIGGGIAACIVLFFFLVQTAPYRLSRFMVYLNPSLDPKGAGYQIQQALLAIGSGGFWGLGLGESRQKYNFLPEAVGDSIFAITAEELGFIGASALVVLFVIFGMRSLRIAHTAPDLFGKYLAVGIASWICFQAFMNIAAITGLIPLTGVTLPFVSHGGSSLSLALAGCGILVNISKYCKQ